MTSKSNDTETLIKKFTYPTKLESNEQDLFNSNFKKFNNKQNCNNLNFNFNKNNNKLATTTTTTMSNANKNRNNLTTIMTTATSTSNTNNNNFKNQNNDSIEIEKTKFFNILKSLFAIFDPECNGCIDLNELDVLGANNNEILNDVLNYIRSNRPSNTNKILKAVNTNLNQTTSKSITNSKRSKLSLSIDPNSNSNKLLVNFDEFVSASEIVLEKRKQIKMSMSQFKTIPINENLDSNLYKSNNGKQKVLSIPITNMINSTSSSSSSTASSNFSTPTSSSLSPTTQTLSQAFDSNHTNHPSLSKSLKENNSLILNNANSCDLNSLIDKENILLKQGLESIDLVKQWYLSQLAENKVKQTNVNKLKYQNLFSIDKMLIDLKQLNDLNTIFNEFIKRNSPQNLQNLQKNTPESLNVQMQAQFMTQSQSPPSYKDYVEQFGLNSMTTGYNSKHDVELDKYLKEKQEKIENLQKEKSSLIRKLFEIKSESENISKNILKLNTNKSSSNLNNNVSGNSKSSCSSLLKDKEIPIQVDKGNNILILGSSSSSICNLVELNKLNLKDTGIVKDLNVAQNFF